MDEVIEDTHIVTTSKSFLLQYIFSLERSSNISSNILLNDVWSSNKTLCDGKAGEHIIKSTNSLLQNADTSNVKHWKTSLSKIDSANLFQKSLPTCSNCTEVNYSGLKQFQKNECKCQLGIAETAKKVSNENLGHMQPNTVFPRAIREGSIHEERSENDNRQIFKPKFGRLRNVSRNGNLPTTSNKNLSEPEIDLTKEEEDEKAHKSNVAKITFKTAKEQLLASNPAARRVLGTSRKAQAKFVSPMIGAQGEKKESYEPDVTDERLKHIDPKMIELIESEIIDKGTLIGWDDIAGLELAKSVIQEAVVWPLLRPDIFTGLRRPPKGILLFGPPGTGKTLIGKCIAAQCNATFFSISASSLTSKWIGDGEKMVRALFAVARCHQPAVIFIDEIDSLLSQRSDTEHEATRRIKTEFLVQFDGAATGTPLFLTFQREGSLEEITFDKTAYFFTDFGDEDRVVVVGATNRPQELDEAARRRLVKRLYIPLPDEHARAQIVLNLLKSENKSVSAAEVSAVGRLTAGYSGADIASLCSEAAMGPVRAVPLDMIVTIDRNKVRPVCLQDFTNALQRVKPSVSQEDLGQYVKWNKTYGQGF